jgi:hypothetical protein
MLKVIKILRKYKDPKLKHSKQLKIKSLVIKKWWIQILLLLIHLIWISNKINR